MTDGANVFHEGNLARRERITILLKQYPSLSENEVGELTEFYRTAAAIDTALISCDAEVAAKALQFARENRKGIERGFQAPLVVATFVLCLASIVIAFYVQMNGGL